MRTITCERCYTTVETKSPSRKYCPPCSKPAHKEKQAAWFQRTKGSQGNLLYNEITCRVCHASFIRRHPHEKYCGPACRTMGLRINQQIWYRKHRKNVGMQMRPCARCNTMFFCRHGKTKYCGRKCKEGAKRDYDNKWRKENKEYYARYMAQYRKKRKKESMGQGGSCPAS